MTNMQTWIKAIDELEQGQYNDNSKELSIFKQVPFFHSWTSYMKPCKDSNPRCFNCLIGLPTNQEGKANQLFS